MTPVATARALAGLQVQRGKPNAQQWVSALGILARAERKPSHWLEVTFTPWGTAPIFEHRLPKVASA